MFNGSLLLCCMSQVDNVEQAPPPAPEQNEGIVGALMMVMQKRSKVIHSSGRCSLRLLMKEELSGGGVKEFKQMDRNKKLTALCHSLFQVKVKMKAMMTMMMMSGTTEVEVLVCVDFVLRFIVTNLWLDFRLTTEN